jgi:hypothetical protein
MAVSYLTTISLRVSEASPATRRQTCIAVPLILLM